MDEQEIQARLDGLIAAMLAKDCVTPSGCVTFYFGAGQCVFLYYIAAGEQNGKSFNAKPDLASAFAEADAWVAAIKDKATREDEAWTAQLGRLIDSGRAIGKDVQFLNPLTAMMEKLSTNIIEGPK